MDFKRIVGLGTLAFLTAALSQAQTARDHARVETGAANFESTWEGNPARLGQAEDYEIDAVGFYQSGGAWAGGTSAVIPGGESGGLGALVGGEFMRMDVGLGYGRAISDSLCMGAFIIADRDSAAKEPSSKSQIGGGALYRATEQLQFGITAQGRTAGSGSAVSKLGVAWITPPNYGATELDLELVFTNQTLGRMAVERPFAGEVVTLRMGVEYSEAGIVFGTGAGVQVGAFRGDYGYSNNGAGGIYALSLSWQPAKRPPAPIQAPPPPSLPIGMPEPPASEISVSPTAEPAPEIE